MERDVPRGGERDVASRAVARLAKHQELALAEVRLSLPQFRLLNLLWGGSAVASALAAHLSVSPPSVTAIVDGLVARQFVERRTDADDRRKVSHVLTDKGRRALTDADEALGQRLRDISRYIPTADRQAAFDALGVWHDALDYYLAAAIAD